MAAFVIAITSAGIEKAAAYTSDELTTATTGAYNVAKNARISAFAMETCTSQITMEDYSHIDACISIIKTFDKYMSLAVSEANSDIQSVTGYGITTTGLN
jgi:hypothetical protein